MAEGLADWIKIGLKVLVKDKGIEGTIRFYGETEFAPGLWVGVELDEPKGKNNGTVKGKTYFECPEQYGLMVRGNQIELVDEWVQPGARVLIKDKNLHGTIRFVGETEFAPGVWVGVELDEAKGKNNGTVKDKVYFECREKHGLMVRIPQVESLGDSSGIPKRRVQGAGSKGSSPITKRSQVPKPFKGGSEKSTPLSSPKPPRNKSPNFTKDEEEEPIAVEASKPTSFAPPTITVEGASEEVKDLQQKLMILQQKRSEDKSKIKELDKFRLQYQQMVEYKTRWTESQTELQQQLKQAKKEARESMLAKEQFEEELRELSDAVEIATLDKEMAEEKCEGLQSENEALKERIQELSLDLEILQNEISESGYEGAAASGQVKQLEQQNSRLKEALMKLRDISNQDKVEHQLVMKDLEKQTHLLTTTTEQKERLEEELKVAEDNITALKEQVDVAMGAEDMVEKLTEQNLQLEEELNQLRETVDDLEALRELSEQQEEIRVEVEHELREELDLNMNSIRQMQLKLDASQETIVDQLQTIEKFRELVRHLQSDLAEVRKQPKEEEGVTESLPSVVAHDFSQMKTSVQSYSRTIDYELRKLEAQQSTEIINHLKSFMPSTFLVSGGDYDALNVTMLLPRLVTKAELIMDQLRQQTNLENALSSLKPGPKTDLQTYVAFLTYKLTTLQKLVNAVIRIMKECDVSLYRQVGGLRDDLVVHERSLDILIELLKKEQLEESVPLNGIEKAINHFENLISARLLFVPQSGQMDAFQDQVKVVTAACDYCSLEYSRLQSFTQEGTGFMTQLKELETFNNDIRQTCRKAKRRLPSARSGKIIKCPPDLFPSLIKQQQLVVANYRTLYDTLSTRRQSLTDNESLTNPELESCLATVSKEVFHELLASGQVTLSEESLIHFCISKMSKTLEEFLNDLQNGEYDAQDPKVKITSPLMLRSQAVKAELSDTEGLKYKIEEKNNEILELKKNIKLKSQEIGEINTKVNLLEKKLEQADSECVRKVEEEKLETERVKTVMEQTEEKFNKAIVVLQKDIETLEIERDNLKQQLEHQSQTPIPADISSTRRSMSLSGRQTLLSLMSRSVPAKSQTTPAAASTPSVGGVAQSEAQLLDSSPLLISQVESLRKALYYSQNENVRLKAVETKIKLDSLPRLNVPKKSLILTKENSEGNQCSDVEKSFAKRTSDLLQDLNNVISQTCVVDITQKDKPLSSRELLAHKMSALLELKDKTDKLKEEGVKLLASGHVGGLIQRHVKSFVSPQFNKAWSESNNPQLLAKLLLPSRKSSTPDTSYYHKLRLSANQFQALHAQIIS